MSRVYLPSGRYIIMHEVHVFKFVVQDSIDGGIVALQRAKSSLSAGLAEWTIAGPCNILLILLSFEIPENLLVNWDNFKAPYDQLYNLIDV